MLRHPSTPPSQLALLLALGGAVTLPPVVAAEPLLNGTTTVSVAFPGAPPPIGLPQLQTSISCPALQQRIAATVGPESSVWSVSVADPQGRLLADLNGTRPRIPASNQKLISTAIALDRLGPDYHLKTQLWRLSDGSLRITGEGDPDFGIPQLQRFAKLALGAGGGPSIGPTAVRIQLAEEPSQRWWPQGWLPSDRAEAYGAPITRLALTGNALDMAVSNPPARLQRLLAKEISNQGGQASFQLVSAAQVSGDSSAVLLHEEPSAPMHNILSLANTESHNFTAEVLLRQGTGQWDLAQARVVATQWLQAQGLPMAGVTVLDGSGLSHGNRVTSRLLAALLLRMSQHPYASDYLASMAVAGQRGTLRHLFNGTSLDGHFRGKTGTITGVRAISGVLDTSEGPRYISMVSNGAGNPNATIGQILRQSQLPGICTSP